MEKIVEVPGTRHSYVEVDLQAIRGNVKWLGSLIQPGTKQMAVIKADAYGHGAVRVVEALTEQVSWFGVANVDEAIELRKAGITLPIMVFGVPTTETAPAYQAYNLTAAVSHLNQLDILDTGVHAHLLFDTGMGRLGMRPEQVADALSAIDQSDVNVNGIMSHFPCADDPDSELSKTQIERFRSLATEFPDDFDRHIHNTGGILYHYVPDCTMVRHGIGIYGYDPGPQPRRELKPALTWKSKVVQSKPLKKGESISYGARWVADRDGWLVTVPVGYADGLPRNLTGKINYCVGDSKLPVRGVISMDYTMLFSDEQVEPGTPVTVLGPEADDARILAEATDTITYELLSRIAPKVPRKYKSE